MKRATVLLALMLAPSAPAWAVSKEILQLQQMVQTLSDRVKDLDNRMTERMALMTQLVEKAADANNRLQTSIDGVQTKLQTAISTQTAAQNQKIDSQAARLQQISDSVDEMKARQNKLSDQLTQLRQFLETVQAQPPAAAQPTEPAPGSVPPTTAPVPAPAPARPPVPSPQALYSNALKDYVDSKTDLAMTGFQEYLKNYPEGERAENAQFYIGEIYYLNAQYTKAVEAYNKVIDGYPKGNKTPDAHLKKGFALAEMRMKPQARKELDVLIRKFPNSDQAKLARAKIAKL